MIAIVVAATLSIADAGEPIEVCTERRLTAAQEEQLAWMVGNEADEPDYEAKLAWEPSLSWQLSPRLKVRFIDDQRQPALEQRVFQAAREWMKSGVIHFEWVNSGPADIRISFRGAGSWSYVGRAARAIDPNAPTMNFGWLGNATPEHKLRRVVLHEFGHALGCIHEHQSPAAKIQWNEPEVYRYFEGPPEFLKPDLIKQEILERPYDGGTQFSAFDPKSIMIYAIPAGLTKDPNFAIPWNESLSDTDREYIDSLYQGSSYAFIDDPTRADCVEAPVAAALFDTGPVWRNEVFANGFAFYLAGPPSRLPALQQAFAAAVGTWASVLKSQRAVLEPELPQVYAKRFAKSERFAVFIPPQVVAVKCPRNATFVVRWDDAPSRAFSAGVIALARVKGRTVLLNGANFDFGLGDQRDARVLSLERVMLHELGHAFGLPDQLDPKIPSVMQPTIGKMAATLTSHDEKAFVELMKKTVKPAAPGVMGTNCAGLRADP